MPRMATAVKTTVTELPESRVRVEAEVPADEVERALQRTARQLGREMRIPGFRKGKVPPPIVIRRVGRQAVLDETVRDDMGRWYTDAIRGAGIAPVGDPEIDLGDLPEEGQPLTFTVEIGVRPKAQLGTYKGVEVGRREPHVADDAVQAELDGLRERAARLETVDRPAQNGDFVVMDYESDFEGGSGRDQMVELGSGRLVPGFEEQLEGVSAGDERTVTITFPDDYQGEHLRGQEKSFNVTVGEVKEKRLPELDDEFALDTQGYDSLDELRDDIRKRMLEVDEQRISRDFREAVVDAAVREATVDVPDTLVDARARELWDRMLHSMAHQGINKDTYLRISGKTEDELLSEARPDAEQALRREAVIAAIIEAEGIEPSDGDVLDALQASAAREGTTPEKLRDKLRQAGRLDDLTEDLAAQQAVDLLVEHATPISVEQAQARDKLWTPEKGAEGAGTGQLWTPGS